MLKWDEHEPPMLPAYFVEIEHLKKVLSVPEPQVSVRALELMLSYFLDHEQYKKAALIRDALPKVQEANSNPPTEHPGWKFDEDLQQWYMELTLGDLGDVLRDMDLDDEDDEIIG